MEDYKKQITDTELKNQQKKLMAMVTEAIKAGSNLSDDLEIFKQSKLVDSLINERYSQTT